MKKKKYLLVVRIGKHLAERTEIFSFESAKNRSACIKDLKKMDKKIEYLTSEVLK